MFIFLDEKHAQGRQNGILIQGFKSKTVEDTQNMKFRSSQIIKVGQNFAQ